MGSMGMPYGLQAMLKEGHKHFSGVEEAVMKSVEACKAIAKCTRTSLGPMGKSNKRNRSQDRQTGAGNEEGGGVDLRWTGVIWSRRTS